MDGMTINHIVSIDHGSCQQCQEMSRDVRCQELWSLRSSYRLLPTAVADVTIIRRGKHRYILTDLTKRRISCCDRCDTDVPNPTDPTDPTDPPKGRKGLRFT